MSPLIEFYRGMGPDDQGRFLPDILREDDYWFERTHNYIQWLFPNAEPSRVAHQAPTLNPTVIAVFQSDPTMQTYLDKSYTRILGFLGLEQRDGKLIKAVNWNNRKLGWFTEETHNNLRITRVLKCLMSLGRTSDAQLFYRTLMILVEKEHGCGVGKRAVRFWGEAVGQLV